MGSPTAYGMRRRINEKIMAGSVATTCTRNIKPASYLIEQVLAGSAGSANGLDRPVEGVDIVLRVSAHFSSVTSGNNADQEAKKSEYGTLGGR